MTTAAPAHTLAVGRTIASKYGALGISGTNMVPPLEHLLGLLVSFPSRGKSHLLQSNPDCFIYNTDGSPTVYNDIPAQIWPGVGELGQPIDTDGSYVSLTFDLMLEKLKVLKAMAEDDFKGRPRFVAVDSLGLMLPLVRDWVVRNAVPLRIMKEPVERWNDLHGPSAWDETYGAIVDFALAHRRLGYGFWFTLHLTQKIIRLNDETSERVVGVNITDNFWSRLFPLFDMIAIVDREEIVRTIPITRKLPDGRTVSGGSKEETVRQHFLVVDPASAPNLRHIVKHRVSMPGKIILPETNTFAAFADAYNKAARTVTPKEDTP